MKKFVSRDQDVQLQRKRQIPSRSFLLHSDILLVFCIGLLMLFLFNTVFLPFAFCAVLFPLLFLHYVFVLRWACHIRLSFSLSADAFQLLSRCWTVSTIVSIEFELRKLISSNPSFCSCCDPTQHRWSPTELVSFGQNGTTLSFRQYDPYALKWLTRP